MYDVYYTTGFGNKVGAGSDVWVNNFVEYVVPHLKVKPILLIHRKRPDDFEGDKFPSKFIGKWMIKKSSMNL